LNRWHCGRATGAHLVKDRTRNNACIVSGKFQERDIGGAWGSTKRHAKTKLSFVGARRLNDASIEVANLTRISHGPERNAHEVPIPRPRDRVNRESFRPGKVFDLTLPLDQVAEGYRAMDERRAIKTLLRS
jgi:hypothetical protein